MQFALEAGFLLTGRHLLQNTSAGLRLMILLLIPECDESRQTITHNIHIVVLFKHNTNQ